MKQASYQSVWCLLRGVVTRQAEVVKRDLLRSKVKLICFVDTLMTLTSVNIKPALFFSLLEAKPRRRRDPSCRPYMRAECVIACSEAIICWRFEVLEEQSVLPTDGRSSFKHQRFSLWDSSWAPAIHKSLVSLFAACIASSETSHSLRELTQSCWGWSWCMASPPLSSSPQQQWESTSF